MTKKYIDKSVEEEYDNVIDDRKRGERHGRLKKHSSGRQRITDYSRNL